MTGRDDQCRVFQRAQVVQRIGIQHKQISGFADFQRTGLGIDAENGGVDGSGCVQGLSRTETGICDQQLQLTPCGDCGTNVMPVSVPTPIINPASCA